MHKLINIFLILIILLLSTSTANASWDIVGTLPYSLASSQAFIANQSMYVVGGGGISNYPNTLTGKIFQGSIASWEQSSSPPLFWHTITGDQTKYLLGGYNFQVGNYSDKVYKINLLGNSVSYDEVSPLPDEIALTDAFIYDDRIFAIGGSNNSGLKSFIYSALIKADKSLGTWELTGNTPVAIAGHRVIVFDDKIFLIGGSTNSGISAKIYRGKILNNGQVIDWEEQANLPIGITRFGLIKIDNNVFLLGGASNNGYTSKIYFSKYENFTLNFHELLFTSLPINSCCSPIIDDENNIYQVGGHDGEYYADVWKINKSELLKKDLDVPLIKQTNPSWKNLIYDNANLWSQTNKTIGVWGCAITAASMVMNYYGISKINNTTPLNPGTLNTWLQSQIDGFTPNGLVNWMAISRLSKNISGINPAFNFDALEYDRESVWSKNNVKADLDNNIPDILEEPGHFVVAKGVTDTTININDPYHSRDTLLNGYNNSFISVRRLIPSHTDLSYIMITGANNLTFDLKSNNISVGESFVQGPITNPTNSLQKSGPDVKTLQLKKPNSQKYILSISSNQNNSYESSIYLYDKNGSPKILKAVGLLFGGGKDEYTIDFNQNSNNQVSLEKKVTLVTLLEDIEKGKNLKLINSTLAITLSTTTKLAQLSSALKQPKAVKTILTQMLFTIKQAKVLIQEPASSTLNQDINTLLQAL